MASIHPAQGVPNGSEADDWATIWQSELAALALDREAQEGVAALAHAFSAGHERAQTERASRHDEPAGRPGPDAPPGTASAVPAAEPRDQQIEQLRRRIAELERGR